MKFFYLLIIICITSISCYKTDPEVLKLLNDIKSQNESMKLQMSSLQQRTDSLSISLRNTNNLVVGIDKKVDSLKSQISLVLIQINSLTSQLTIVGNNIVDIQLKISELQKKCEELTKILNDYIESVRFSSLENGLIAYFPFTGNTNDYSGNQNNGILNGAKLTSDRFNNIESAYTFSNVEDNSITGTLKTPLGDSFTISFWAKRNTNQVTGASEQNDKEWLFASGNSTTGSATNIGISNNSKILRYGPWGLDGFNSGIEVKDSWVHYVQTYSNGEFNLYINGILSNSGKSIIKLTSGLFSIGCQSSPYTKQGFNGAMDEVRLYNRVLTIDEILYLSKH